MGKKLFKSAKHDQHLLMMNSQNCTNVSRLMDLNSNKTSTTKKQTAETTNNIWNYVWKSTKCNINKYRHLLHGDPCSTTLWRESKTPNRTKTANAMKTHNPICKFGMTRNTPTNLKCVRKPTGFVNQKHQIAQTQMFPPKLCKTTCNT